jgi:hypothetical protein
LKTCLNLEIIGAEIWVWLNSLKMKSSLNHGILKVDQMKDIKDVILKYKLLKRWRKEYGPIPKEATHFRIEQDVNDWTKVIRLVDGKVYRWCSWWVLTDFTSEDLGDSTRFIWLGPTGSSFTFIDVLYYILRRIR